MMPVAAPLHSAAGSSLVLRPVIRGDSVRRQWLNSNTDTPNQWYGARSSSAGSARARRGRHIVLPACESAVRMRSASAAHPLSSG